MIVKFTITIDAQADIRKIVEWYDEQREGLGEIFYQRLLQLFGYIRSNPDMYGSVKKRIRVATTRKFPHACYFSCTPEEILIIAVQHGRRSDRHWRRRLQ